jgi:hypothetical protein
VKTYKEKTILVIDSIECDICHRKNSEDVEIDEFHSIDKTVGYFNDTFPDMSKIEIDICPACLKEKLGDNLRITPYNS